MSDTATNSRRRFIQYATMAAVGAQTMLKTGNLKASVETAKAKGGLAAPWPEMEYRRLGRTGFKASRLVFGCGAALSKRPQEELLNAALDAGVNVFDVGFKHYYDDAEKHLGPFVRAHRDKIFLISKAYVPIDIEPHESMTLSQSKAAAAGWAAFLDESLKEMGVDHVDAYYQMGANNTSVVGSEEIHNAFLSAKAAGKVGHYGVSTHQNAQAVLGKIIETGWYDLAMLAITPGGWYDWKNRDVLDGSPTMAELGTVLAQARDAGIGLVGMKAGRYLAGRRFLGKGDEEGFDKHYDPALLQSGLSAFQRSYAYVLEHGMDVVNADMQNIAHLKENFVAAATATRFSNVA